MIYNTQKALTVLLKLPMTKQTHKMYGDILSLAKPLASQCAALDSKVIKQFYEMELEYCSELPLYQDKKLIELLLGILAASPYATDVSEEDRKKENIVEQKKGGIAFEVNSSPDKQMMSDSESSKSVSPQKNVQKQKPIHFGEIALDMLLSLFTQSPANNAKEGISTLQSLLLHSFTSSSQIHPPLFEHMLSSHSSIKFQKLLSHMCDLHSSSISESDQQLHSTLQQ